MISRRIHFLDALKVLAIFLIALYHFNHMGADVSAYGQDVLGRYYVWGLFGLGVPLFFMVNGALLLNRPLHIGKHVKKMLIIAVLTIIWGALTLLLLAPLYKESYTWQTFFEALYTLRLGRINHLWFLVAILFVYFFFPLIKAVYDAKRQWIGYALFLSLAVATMVEPFRSIATPYLGPYAYAFVYFLAGGYLYKERKRFHTPVVRSASLILFVLSSLALFGYGLQEMVVSGRFFDTVWQGYRTLTMLVMASSLFIFFSSFQFNRIAPFLTVVGSSTLGMYVLHATVGQWSLGPYRSLAWSETLWGNALYGLFLFSATLVLTQIIIRIPIFKRLMTLR